MRHLIPLLVLLLASVAARGEEPPNIVLIISDDAAWTDYGFMGHPDIQTPRLDRLASESLVFERGYVPSSLCCPSLASIITGLYPFEHRITGNEPPRPAGVGRGSPAYREAVAEMIGLIDESATLPTLLGDEGYVSLQTGKWWLGGAERGGFTEGMTHGDPDRGGRHGDEGLKIGRQTMRPITEFLDKHAGTPFLLWYAPFLPHTPHNPPERLFEKYAEVAPTEFVARYWACCEWFDETCGQLLDALDERGLTNNTIVVFVTDNGWIQRPNANGYAARSKRSPYDGGLRTPIMVRWPARVVPGRVETPVSAVDIAPTVLAAAGVAVPAAMTGVDLLDAEAVADRGPVFGDVHLHNARDTLVPSANLTHRWIIDGRWKLIVPHEPNSRGEPVELFDLETDPFEASNLAAAEPERVGRLRERLDRWWLPSPVATDE